MSKKNDVKPVIDYTGLITDIKQRVRHAQTRAVLAVNAELIQLYWEIGALIDRRQQQEGWGSSVIPRLARDLHNELPEEKGFSERNIKRMLAFYREYPHLDFVPQAVAQMAAPPNMQALAACFPAELMRSVPWGHHAELMAKVKDHATRQWYMQATLHHGWSRNILLMQIETAAPHRQGRAVTNFAKRLPPPDSDLVQQTRHEPEKPTIGLILCQQPDRVLAEYALRGIDKPIGVSSFELTRALPKTLESSLPSIEQIERELEGNHE